MRRRLTLTVRAERCTTGPTSKVKRDEEAHSCVSALSRLRQAPCPASVVICSQPLSDLTSWRWRMRTSDNLEGLEREPDLEKTGT